MEINQLAGSQLDDLTVSYVFVEVINPKSKVDLLLLEINYGQFQFLVRKVIPARSMSNSKYNNGSETFEIPYCFQLLF